MDSLVVRYLATTAAISAIGFAVMRYIDTRCTAFANLTDTP